MTTTLMTDQEKQPESQPPSETVQFQLDAEHTGIRLTLPLITFGGFILGYSIASSILAANNPESNLSGFLPFAVGMILAIIGAVLGDKLLKRFWPSRRLLMADPQQVILLDPRHSQITLRWDLPINRLYWRFVIKRGSPRAPKGWLVLGCQFSQDEAQFTIYTFAPEKDAKLFPHYEEFTLLVSRANLEKSELSLREASEQRRLLRAEDERWNHGYEVQRRDFARLLDLFHNHPVTEPKQP